MGTQAQNTKLIYNDVENMNKSAVALNNSYSSSSKSSGISTEVTINYNHGFQTEANAVSISASKSKMNSNGTTYQNGRFVNVNEVHNNTKNMMLSGFHQEGGSVTGNIENLTMESKQNTSTTTGSTKGGSLGISPTGIPLGSVKDSKTKGERKVVDTPTTFLIGEGSHVKVGKVENTAGAIGITGSGKLSIEEYVGHNLENVDKSKTKGGSVGITATGISSIGVEYSDRKQEGVIKNTVVGNVEIGKSSGEEIHKELSSMTEITKDRKFETNIHVEAQTINYVKNPEKWKEDLEVAILEGKSTGRTVVKTIDNVINGDKSQDIGEAERRSLIEIKEAIVRVQTSPAMDIIAEEDLTDKNVQARLKVEIEKFDPNAPSLSKKVKERLNELKAEGKEIVAFYDKRTGKIFINQNAKEEEVRASIAREYKIKEDLELGRGKANEKGQLRSTIAGEIAYDEIKDRLKKGDKNPIHASHFEVAKMDKESEVTADLADKDVEAQYFNSLPYAAVIGDGSVKVSPDILKAMRGNRGEISDYTSKPNYFMKTNDKEWAETEDGKKKIAIADSKIDSFNKNNPDREYYKIIDGRKKEVLIASNPKAKSYWYHFGKSFSAPFRTEGYGMNVHPNSSFTEDVKELTGIVFRGLNDLSKPFTLGIGSKLGDEKGRIRKRSNQYGTKEEVEGKQEFLKNSLESATDMVVTPITMKLVGTGIKILDKKMNYPKLTYDEYKFLKEYKYKPISGEITSKYEDIKTYRYNATTNPGPLAEGKNPPINNFYGGMYNDASDEGGIFVRMGNEKNSYGNWYTRIPKNSEVQARIDLAIKKWWVDSNGEIKIRGYEADKSILNTGYYIKFPEGIPKYKGPVGYQGGSFLGGLDQEQYFIPNSWKYGEIIETYPVK